MKSGLCILLLSVLLAATWLLHSVTVPEKFSQPWALRAFLASHRVMSAAIMLASDLGIHPWYKTVRLLTKKQASRVSLPDDVITEDTRFAGVSVRLYKPRGFNVSFDHRKDDGNNDYQKLTAGVVFYQGGGFVIGTGALFESQLSRMASELGLVVAAIKYCLAPECTFPAPQRECLEATRYFLKNSVQYGVDRNRVALIGDSVGGSLAVSVALKLGDEMNAYESRRHRPLKHGLLRQSWSGIEPPTSVIRAKPQSSNLCSQSTGYQSPISSLPRTAIHPPSQLEAGLHHYLSSSSVSSKLQSHFLPTAMCHLQPMTRWTTHSKSSRQSKFPTDVISGNGQKQDTHGSLPLICRSQSEPPRYSSKRNKSKKWMSRSSASNTVFVDPDSATDCVHKSERQQKTSTQQSNLDFKSDSEALLKPIKLQVLLNPVLQVLDFQLPSYMENQNGPLFRRNLVARSVSLHICGDETCAAPFLNNHHTISEVKRALQDHMSHRHLPEEYKYPAFEPPDLDCGDSEIWKKLGQILLDSSLSPLIAPDLSSMPKTYVLTSQYDMHRDEGILFAERLRKADVEVEHDNIINAFHGIVSVGSMFVEGRQAQNKLIAFLRDNL